MKVPTDLPIYLKSTSLNVGGGTNTVASFAKQYPRVSECFYFVFSRLVVQGVPTQTVIFHFALAGRNMQASFGLKVIWES